MSITRKAELPNVPMGQSISLKISLALKGTIKTFLHDDAHVPLRNDYKLAPHSDKPDLPIRKVNFRGMDAKYSQTFDAIRADAIINSKK